MYTYIYIYINIKICTYKYTYIKGHQSRRSPLQKEGIFKL